MLNLNELKALLVQAKEDGCTKFPEDKGYKGSGYSVMERIAKFVAEEKGVEANITKSGLKALIKKLRSIKEFKGLTKFSAEPRKQRVSTGFGGRVNTKPSLSSIFGLENNLVNTEPAPTTSTQEWGAPLTPAEPVTVDADDDPFI